MRLGSNTIKSKRARFTATPGLLILPDSIVGNPARSRSSHPSRFPNLTPTRASNFGSFDTEAPYILSSGIIDYYEILGIDDDATPAEIKSAYRALCKVCHPDISGEEEGHNMCILLNEAYDVLMDAEQRRLYNASLDEALEDEDDGFKPGVTLSKWCANTKMGKNSDPNESRAVFVDEIACIGCKQCVWVAPATFRIEEQYGRSRVFGQWLDVEDDIQAAMDACPVSCIHWTNIDDLPVLEYVTANKLKRVNVGVMMAGQGGAIDDVWDVAARFLKEREEKRIARERAARMSREQAERRAAAAAKVAQQQATWFETVAEKFGINEAAEKIRSSMESTVSSIDSEDEYSGYRKVGKRKRNRQPAPGRYGARGAEGGYVPKERALVPVGAARPKWQKD